MLNKNEPVRKCLSFLKAYTQLLIEKQRLKAKLAQIKRVHKRDDVVQKQQRVGFADRDLLDMYHHIERVCESAYTDEDVDGVICFIRSLTPNHRL